MMGHHGARVLVLVMLYNSVSSISNLTSQLWIDFVSEQPDGLYKYSECLAGHSCDSISQENTEALSFMEVVTGNNGELRDSGSTKLCSCNLESCVRYGTCCRDALNGTIPKPDVTTSCITQSANDFSNAFHANIKCPPEFTDSTIIDLCNTPIDRGQSSTPDLAHWFVSSNLTEYTYRNIYCALCNGETMSNLVFWDLDLHCPEQPPAPGPVNLTEFKLNQLHSSCDVHFQSGPLITLTSCQKAGILSTCPAAYNNPTIREKCELGETAMIYDSNSQALLRNVYCADCNEIPYNDLICIIPPGTIVIISVRILVQPFGNSCTESEYFTTVPDGSCNAISSMFASCADGEIYNWADKMCQTICPEPLEWVNGQCAILQTRSADIITNPAEGENITNFSNSSAVNYNCTVVSNNQLVTKFQENKLNSKLAQHVTGIDLSVDNVTAYCTSCDWILLSSADVMIDNDVLTLTLNGTMYPMPLYIDNNNSRVFVCANSSTAPTEEPIGLLGEICLKVEETAVSVTLLSISIACLIITLTIYIILSTLHNVPGYIVMSQVIPLLLGYIFFILRLAVEDTPVGCYIVSVLTHYMLLASSMWAFLFAVEITITITSVYAVNQKSKKKFIKYSIFGWSIPLVPVIVALIIEAIDSTLDFAPQYGQPQCWFNSPYGLYLYFLIPIAVLLALNIISYTVVITKFAILAYQTRGVKTSHSEKLILSIKLFFAFGLLWVFGILSAIFRDNPHLACVFLFVNSLSGALLMLVFICNGKVLNSLRKRLDDSFRSDTATSTKSTNGDKKNKLLTNVNTSNSNPSSTRSSFNTNEPLHSSQL